MRINNGSNDPVEWVQNGGNPPANSAAAQSQQGQLQGQSQTGPMTPAGTAPWSVTFTNLKKSDQKVDSGKFSDPDATVTLNADWTVTVS